jgi:transcriptional regulator with XRE-family HTH domain
MLKWLLSRCHVVVALSNAMTKKQPPEGESPLKILRERLNLTQEELSRRCNIPLRTYVRWETGEATPRPTIPQVKALCRELGIPIEDLPDEFGPMRSQSEND